MQSNLISIIIVNWNANHQLRACVDSINQFSGELVEKIIIVDNGSTDGSGDTVEGLPNVTLIRAGENLGFAKACNLGASQSKSKYLLFLNPDTLLYPNSLSVPLEYMEKPQNSRIGICGIQQINEANSVARHSCRFPTLQSLLSRSLGLDHIIKKSAYLMLEWDHSDTRKVDHVIGSFYFVRKTLFDQLNGFDESFFIYLEDLDFSLRAKKIGYRSVYLADAQMFHAGGGTSRQIKAKRLFYSLRSKIIYSFKHFNKLGALTILIATIAIEPITRSVFAIINRSRSNLSETWAAYRMLLEWLPKWILKGSTH